MVVRIRTEKDLHDNFYEGSHVGLHKRKSDSGEGEVLLVIVEGRKDSVTIEVEEGSKSEIFIMNDSGRTIESKYV